MQKTIYELTVVVSDKKTEKETKAIVDALLEKVGGRLVDFSFWGKKDLVYSIKKQEAAVFALVELELDRTKVTDLVNRIKLNDEVLRHMLVICQQPTKISKKTKEISNKQSLAQNAKKK